MLRATSEMAVAISVWSVLEKPPAAAISRPFCRAVTTSRSVAIGTRASDGVSAGNGRTLPLGPAQDLETFLEIQGSRDAVQRQAELDHGEGDLRLNSDHHRLGPAQLGDVRDSADRSRGERIEDIERREIDHHPATPKAAHAFGELVPELHQILVRQGRLDRRHQDVALLEDGD